MASHVEEDGKTCTTIAGNLKIESDAARDLGGLRHITSIDGDLSILLNKNLRSLKGLDNVRHVGGSLTFCNNAGMPNMKGLHNIARVGADVSICANDDLEDMSGLDSLEVISGDLGISWNMGTRSSLGFESLKFVGGTLAVVWTAFENFDGFNHLEEAGNVVIKDNITLTSIGGLASLRTIKGSFEMSLHELPANNKEKTYCPASPEVAEQMREYCLAYQEILENM